MSAGMASQRRSIQLETNIEFWCCLCQSFQALRSSSTIFIIMNFDKSKSISEGDTSPSRALLCIFWKECTLVLFHEEAWEPNQQAFACLEIVDCTSAHTMSCSDSQSLCMCYTTDIKAISIFEVGPFIRTAPTHICIKCNANYFHSLINPLIIWKSVFVLFWKPITVGGIWTTHSIPLFACLHKAYFIASIPSFLLFHFINLNSCIDKW
jgi:hypothetical protein